SNDLSRVVEPGSLRATLDSLRRTRSATLDASSSIYRFRRRRRRMSPYVTTDCSRPNGLRIRIRRRPSAREESPTPLTWRPGTIGPACLSPTIGDEVEEVGMGFEVLGCSALESVCFFAGHDPGKPDRSTELRVQFQHGIPAADFVRVYAVVGAHHPAVVVGRGERLIDRIDRPGGHV